MGEYDGGSGGNVDGKDISPASVDTDEILGVADGVILDGDDATSIIESASNGDVIFVETGVFHSITETVDFPANLGLIAFGGSQSGEYAILNKEFNGTLANLANNLYLQGIYFRGNKGNGWTGDGAVDPAGTSHITAVRCRFGNHAGDGRVHHESFWHDYHHCRFDTNDGWGVRTKDTGTTTHSSQISYDDWCFIRGNALGGILYEDVTNMLCPDIGPVAFENNGGPCIHTRGSVYDLSVYGHIVSNDGPALLIDEYTDGTEGVVEGLDWRANVEDCNQNPSLQNSRHTDAGAIHLQRTSGLFGANVGGRIRGGTGTDGLLVSDSDAGADVRANISAFTRGVSYSARINGGDIRLFGFNVGVTLDSANAYAVEIFENQIANPDTGERLFFDAGEVKVEDSGGTTTTLS